MEETTPTTQNHIDEEIVHVQIDEIEEMLGYIEKMLTRIRRIVEHRRVER